MKRGLALFWAALWRWVAMLAAIFALLAVAALFAPKTFAYVPPADSGGGCASISRNVGLYANNYHITVSVMHQTQTRCWGSTGYLTYTTNKIWFTNTSWGSLFGVKIATGGQYILWRSGNGIIQYAQDFVISNCFAYYTQFCGPNLSFRVVTQIVAPRLGGWYWWGPFCTSSGCNARLSFRAA